MKASLKEFVLKESNDVTHPCNELYEILGSTVTYR